MKVITLGLHAILAPFCRIIHPNEHVNVISNTLIAIFTSRRGIGLDKDLSLDTGSAITQLNEYEVGTRQFFWPIP